MSCLSNIVTLGICPDDDASLSGYRLIDAPGMSLRTLSGVADGDVTTGVDMALIKKDIAINRVKNDFLAAMAANKVSTSFVSKVYETTDYSQYSDAGTYSGFRGLSFHKARKRRGTLSNTIIEAIQLYPLQSGTTTLKMELVERNSTTAYTWQVALTGGQINELPLAELPFIIPQNTETIRVTVDQTNISFRQSDIICYVGCNGTEPNDCGWADGWTGTNSVKSKSYGVGLKFRCECDYDRLLCSMSKTFIGELIYLQWQMEVLRERYMSDRFNWMVIYDREDIMVNVIPEIEKRYREVWSSLMGGALNILSSYSDFCLNCRGIRWVTNV